jgi:hypothetical protein
MKLAKFRFRKSGGAALITTAPDKSELQTIRLETQIYEQTELNLVKVID